MKQLKVAPTKAPIARNDNPSSHRFLSFSMHKIPSFGFDSFNRYPSQPSAPTSFANATFSENIPSMFNSVPAWIFVKQKKGMNGGNFSPRPPTAIASRTKTKRLVFRR